MEQVLIWCAIALIAAIPFQEWTTKLYTHFKRVNSRIEKPESKVALSKLPFIVGISKCWSIALGFVTLLISDQYFGTDNSFLITITILMLAHQWSLWKGFKPHHASFWLLIGVYTYMQLYLGLYFIGFCILISLIVNSISIGRIASIFIIFGLIWFLQLSPVYLVANFIIFSINLVAYKDPIFEHFEKGSDTIINTLKSHS